MSIAPVTAESRSSIGRRPSRNGLSRPLSAHRVHKSTLDLSKELSGMALTIVPPGSGLGNFMAHPNSSSEEPHGTADPGNNGDVDVLHVDNELISATLAPALATNVEYLLSLKRNYTALAELCHRQKGMTIELKGEVKRLQLQLAHFQVSEEAVERDKQMLMVLQDTTAKHERRIHVLQEERERLQERIQTLQSQVAMSVYSRDDAAAKLLQAQTALQQAKEQLVEAQADNNVDLYQRQVTMLEARCAQLEAEVADLRRAVSAKEEELSKHKQDTQRYANLHNRLQQDKANVADDYERLRARLDQQLSRNRALAEQLEQAKIQEERSNDVAATLRSQVSVLKREYDRALARLGELEKQGMGGGASGQAWGTQSGAQGNGDGEAQTGSSADKGAGSDANPVGAQTKARGSAVASSWSAAKTSVGSALSSLHVAAATQAQAQMSVPYVGAPGRAAVGSASAENAELGASKLDAAVSSAFAPAEMLLASTIPPEASALIRELRAGRDTLRAQFETLWAERCMLEKRLHGISDTTRLAKAELLVAVDRERRQTLIMSELSSQVADLTQQLTKMVNDKDGLSHQMDALQDELQTMMAKMLATQRAKESLEQRVSTLEEELREAQATVEDYRAREHEWYSQERDNENDDERRHLQTLVEQLQQVNLLLDHDNRKYEDFVTKQRVELSRMQEESLRLKEKLVATETERDRLATQSEDAVKNNPEVAKLQTMLVASDKMVQALQKQLAEAQGQVLLQQKENSELRITMSVIGSSK